jgi:hypothetical protein
VNQEVLFDYVFKQALANLDTLINLNPENNQVKYARAALLQAKFDRPLGRCYPEAPAHKEYCAFSEIGLCTCGSNTASFKPPAAKARCVCWDNKQFCDCVEPRPQGGAKTTSAPEDSEKLGEVLAGPGKPWLQELVDQEKKPEPAAAPKMDFTGRWLMDNGKIAVVENHDGVSWRGYFEGDDGTTVGIPLRRFWNEDGTHTFDEGFSLKTRLREGAKYR